MTSEDELQTGCYWLLEMVGSTSAQLQIVLTWLQSVISRENDHCVLYQHETLGHYAALVFCDEPKCFARVISADIGEADSAEREGCNKLTVNCLEMEMCELEDEICYGMIDRGYRSVLDHDDIFHTISEGAKE